MNNVYLLFAFQSDWMSFIAERKKIRIKCNEKKIIMKTCCSKSFVDKDILSSKLCILGLLLSSTVVIHDSEVEEENCHVR